MCVYSEELCLVVGIVVVGLVIAREADEVGEGYALGVLGTVGIRLREKRRECKLQGALLLLRL